MKKLLLLLFFLPLFGFGQYTITDNDNSITVSGGGDSFTFGKSETTLSQTANRLIFTTNKRYAWKFANITSPSYSTLDSLYDVVKGYVDAYHIVGDVTGDLTGNVTGTTWTGDLTITGITIADSVHANWYGGVSADFEIGESGYDVTFDADTLKGAPVWSGNMIVSGTLDQTITNTTAGGDRGINLYLSQTTTALTGELIGIKANARINYASSGGTVRGGHFSAGNMDAGYALSVATGVYAEVTNKIPSGAVTWTDARGVEINMDLDQGSAGNVNTITNACMIYGLYNLPTSGTYVTVTNGYGMFLRNEAVGGTGQMLDAAIYIDDKSHSGGIKGWDYGLDFSGVGANSGSFGTADIRGVNGETISNATNGTWDFGTANLVTTGDISGSEITASDTLEVSAKGILFSDGSTQTTSTTAYLHYGEMSTVDNANATTIDAQDQWHALNNDISEGYTDGFTFQAGISGTMASAATGGSGDTVVFKDVAHGLSLGDYITTVGTTDYNGIFEVVRVNTDSTFSILDTWVSDQSGTWDRGTCLTCDAGSGGFYRGTWFASVTCETNAHVFDFAPCKNATVATKAKARNKFSNADFITGGGGALMEVSDGDKIFFVIQNTSGTGNITIRTRDMNLVKVK